MSYSCTICFKTIKPEDVYEFLANFKQETIKHFDDIAESEYMWHPISKDFRFEDIDEAVKDREYMYKGADWAKEYVFKHRYFYLPKLNLLGMFSVDKSLHYLFDNVSYFQNSCDQDYDFEDWKGIEEFERIAHNWSISTDEQVEKRYYACEYPSENDKIDDYDYYRRSYAYEDIWDLVGRFLEDDKSVVYLSLFGGYELFEMTQFSATCMKKYQNWVHKVNEKKENEDAAKTSDN